MPKVTIITIVYNVERFIEQCVVSLLEQTFDDIEFLIINDCTPDLSIVLAKEVIQRYPLRKNQVKIINQPINLGSGATRRLGVENATGKYIIHIDSDDYCEPDMIERLYQKAFQSDADIVVCDYFVNFSKRQLYKSQFPVSSGMECVSCILSGKMHASTGNKLIRRDLYIDNGINFISGIDMWEDIATVSRLCYHAKIVSYLPEAFLHYRQTNYSSYTSQLNDMSIHSMIKCIDTLEVFFSNEQVLQYLNKEINYLKLNAQCVWLKETKGNIRKKLISKYRESNDFLLQHPTIPIYYRYALHLMHKKHFWFGNLMVALLNRIKKIRNYA